MKNPLRLVAAARQDNLAVEVKGLDAFEIRHLAGEPIVVRVWQRVSSLNVADACVVATDSPEVQEACVAAGAEVIMTSGSHLSGTDRVAEVCRSGRFRSFDTIINVQGDEPYVLEGAIREAAALVTDGPYEIATAASRGNEADLASQDVVKVIVSDNGAALLFSRAPVPFLRAPEDAPLRARYILRHVGLYVYGRDALLRWVALPEHPLERVERLEQLRPLMAGETIGVAIVEGTILPGIDTEADLAIANENWKAFTSGTR